MALETSNGTYVFFSYAQRDRRFRDKLENHLCNLKYRRLITTWHDQEIRAGEEWAQQVNIYLNKARIILLLISDDFMASEYCHGFEMKRALERHEQGEAHVIPILLRPVLFTDEPFAKLQMLPKNGKPVTRWGDRDSAFVDIARGIEKIALLYKTAEEKSVIIHETHIRGYSTYEHLGTEKSSDSPDISYEPPSQTPQSERPGGKRSGLLPYLPVVILFVGSISLLVDTLLTSRVVPPPHTSQYITTTPTPLPTAIPTPVAHPLFNALTTPLFLSTGGILLSLIIGATVYFYLVICRKSHLIHIEEQHEKRYRQLEQERLERENREAIQKLEQLTNESIHQLEKQRKNENITWQEILTFLMSKREAFILEGRRIDDSRLRRFVARVFQKPEWQGREVAQKRRYYEDAFRAYYHAIIENPFDSEVFCSLGNTCCALQRYAVAFDAFRQAIRFHPTAEAWAGIGNALAKLQQHQQAIEAYEEALRLDNDVTLDYEELVQALMELGRVQEAEHYRERARELGYYDE